MANLVPDSGIQFIDIPVNLGSSTELNKRKKIFAELSDEDDEAIDFRIPFIMKTREGILISKEDLNSDAFDDNGDVVEENIREEFIVEIDSAKTFKISYAQALSTLEEVWIPIPYFKTQSTGEIGNGPLLWSRMYLSRNIGSSRQYTHILTLAFDTTIRENDRIYETLKKSDLRNLDDSYFQCPRNEQKIEAFYSESGEWVFDWLYDVFDLNRDDSFKKYNRFETLPMGVYITFIHLLHEAGAFPRIKLATEKTEPIDISLVLDIGNSRTCGLILETSTIDGKPFEFRTAQKLSIRDLSYPLHKYSEPFDMRVAFYSENFATGDYLTPDFQHYNEVFKWPSLVRVGAEAARFVALSDSSTSQNFFLSSPKRFLWDEQERHEAWKSIAASRKGEIEFNEAFYGIAKSFTSNGDFIVQVDRDGKTIDYDGKGENKLKKDLKSFRKNATGQIASAAPGNSKYSRKSLMTFTLFELLLQALTQINSHEYRSKQDFPNVKRRLTDVVITCPTAMTINDQRSLHNAADDALDLIKKNFDDSFIDYEVSVIPNPQDLDKEMEEKKNWMYDEASCSQLAYLYGEISYRFSDDVAQFFACCGSHKKGMKYPDDKSIVLASIDIGGGTTDLMITSYQVKPNTENSVIEPQPLFWEGFNLAGDDILKRIVERIVLPQLLDEAKTKGVRNIKTLASDFFGSHTGKLVSKDRALKKHVTNQIILGLAYGYIELASESREIDLIKFDEFFQNRSRPNQDIIDAFNKKIQQYGAKGFDLTAMVFKVDVRHVNDVIKQTLGTLLSNINAIISQFSCDIVLLAGKPSKLSIIRQLILKDLPITPDKIISLGNYRIGNWYPFSASEHYIKDPKTIVTVGAAISYMSEVGRLGAFQFDTEPLKQIGSTANYIGKYDAKDAQIDKINIFLLPDQPSSKIKFSGGKLIIGKRQLENDKWMAAPIYKIEYKDNHSATKLKANGYAIPFEITIERSEVNKEELSCETHVDDANGEMVHFNSYFKMTPLSTANELDYWMDSGCYTINLL